MNEREDLFVMIAEAAQPLESLQVGGRVGKRVINRFVRLIRDHVDEPRQAGKVSYPLHEIIVLTFFAVLAGADSFSAVASCCSYKEKYLRKFLELKHGIPTHDTFNRVFSLIDLEQMEDAVVAFVSESFEQLRSALKIPKPRQNQICVDGTVSRGSGRCAQTHRPIKDIQTLHVYSTSDGICLHSRQIEEKTNEIPVAQQILSSMDLKGTLVSFDAMNTQVETLKVIIAGNGYYIGALKGNHKTMLEECERYFDQEYVQLARADGQLSYHYMEKAHNQIESMEFLVAPVNEAAGGSLFGQWPGIKSVVRYEKRTEELVTGRKTREIRYYISNLSGKASEAAMAVRTHWQVESFHWLLDVVFSDDANTTVNRRASGNMSMLTKMALSLYRMMKPLEQVQSISEIKRLFAYNYEDGVARLLARCDKQSISHALYHHRNNR
jgi:predicted transposase YbfD/YdcC